MMQALILVELMIILNIVILNFAPLPLNLSVDLVGIWKQKRILKNNQNLPVR